MLAVVSHDLRSPLSAIYNAVELIDRELGDTAAVDLRRHVALIQRSAERMNRLIGDLLDLESMQAGTFSIRPAPQRVEAIVEETRESLRTAAEAKRIALVHHVAAGVPDVPCDKDRVVQALSNYVSNAVKFTPAGGAVEVRVIVEGPGVRFEVRDTGPGIPAASLGGVFERGWKNPDAGRGGHGLGLSIVRGIVSAHGGTVDVRSEPGRGCVFSFTLPVARPGPS